MDRKGPEHHYDENESPENGRSIVWQQGEIAPDHVNVEGEDYDLRSPSGGRPYRGQPSPLESEMDRYRDMPLDGHSPDEGGNQFRTDKGILASKGDKEDDEGLEQLDEATEPKGLGQIDPVKDNEWPPGDITSRPARDEMLGSVRHAEFEGDNDIWNDIIDQFEGAKKLTEEESSADKIAAASWLENDGQNSNIPVEHLGWDIVEVVEPSKKHTEAANKYSMPLPLGITDNLHNALIELNVWVENPEENGKLRPYKDYWSVIRPKINKDSSIQIGVEDSKIADLINHIARTDDSSALDKVASLNKQSWAPILLRALPMVTRGLGAGAVESGAAGGIMGQALNLGKNLALMHGVSDIAGGVANAAEGALGSGGDQQQFEQMPTSPSSFGVISAYSYDPETGEYSEIPEGQYGAQAAPGAKASPSGYVEPSDIRNPQGQFTGPNPMAQPGYTPPGYSEEAEDIARRQQQEEAARIRAQQSYYGEMPESELTAEESQYASGGGAFETAPLSPSQKEKEKEMEVAIQKELSESAQKVDLGEQMKYYRDYEDLPAAGKALAWGKGLFDIGKELFSQPNKALQTRGVDQPTRGPESFGVIGKTATYGDSFDHPSTVNRRVQDPENGELFPSTRTQTVDGPLGDQEWQRDYLDVNEIGQSRDIRGDDYEKENIKRFYAAESTDKHRQERAVKNFFDSLPLIMQFFLSEDSGFSDPIVRSVHEDLDEAFPGYLDLAVPNEENEILLILNESSLKESNVPGFDVKTMTPGNRQMLQPQIYSPAVNDKCPRCNKVMDPSQKMCPNCSADTAGAFSPAGQPNLVQYPQLNTVGSMKNSSDTQGPHTDEQQAAVAELLLEQGREDEIPLMLQAPADYDAELAEIQNKDPMLAESPEDVGMAPQDQMAGMGGPGPDGGMLTMPNEGMPPGLPPMGAPTPGDLNPAGPGAMQPPAMQLGASVTSSMLHAAFKHGADNVAGKCPNCDGHTTKMMQQDGVSKCHSCGHEWTDNTYQKSDGDSSNSVTTSSFYAAMDSFIDEEVDEEPEIDNSTHTWADQSGEPLQEGQEYEVYAHNYEIPDIGRVTEVKPNSITYEIESEGGLRTTIEIDRKEADLNGYRFVPTTDEADGSANRNGFGIEDKIAPTPGQTTDLSTPHREIGASVKESIAQFFMCPVADCEFNSGGGDYEPGVCPIHNEELVPAGQEKSSHKIAGKHYTPMEQRELIDEYGQARNANKLNLEGTHYVEADDDYFLFGC